MVAEGGEGENPLPFSLQPKTRRGLGGGGRGGYPGFVSLKGARPGPQALGPGQTHQSGSQSPRLLP